LFRRGRELAQYVGWLLFTMTSTRAELGSPIPSRQAEELAANYERGAPTSP
jgi:hypothetical protein